MSDPRPIGVFDSGVGGLTVLREILRRLPFEATIYLGDNARAPYGVRSDDEVRRFSIQALDALVQRDVKALVVACNTSTSVALGEFRRRYDLPVLGVVRPGAAAAALATRNRRVGVIATPATVRSRAYFNAIKDENPAIEVYEHATPTLVPLVEAGILTGPEVEEAVRRAIAPLLGDRDGLTDLADNLISNAIRYTLTGGRVTVEVNGRDGDPRLTVSDTGIGIPPDDLPRIFEEFFRGEKAKQAVQHGTGLGMTIAKRVADMHGGRIEVASEVGRGTTFRVYFPQLNRRA